MREGEENGTTSKPRETKQRRIKSQWGDTSQKEENNETYDFDHAVHGHDSRTFPRNNSICRGK